MANGAKTENLHNAHIFSIMSHTKIPRGTLNVEKWSNHNIFFSVLANSSA